MGEQLNMALGVDCAADSRREVARLRRLLAKASKTMVDYANVFDGYGYPGSAAVLRQVAAECDHSVPSTRHMKSDGTEAQ